MGEGEGNACPCGSFVPVDLQSTGSKDKILNANYLTNWNN